MEKDKVTLDELVSCRERLINEIKSVLSDEDRKFLISFVSNEPNWSLLRDEKIKDFPSVRWKLFNQSKISQTKLDIYIQKVSDCLAGGGTS